MAYERKSYTIGLSGLLVAWVSLGVSYQAIRASWQIAELSGSLDKSELQVGIGAYLFPSSGAVHIIAGSSALPQKSSPVIGSIPFKIASTGKKSIDGVAITFQYHPLFKRVLLHEVDASSDGDIGPTTLRRSIHQSDDRVFMSYRIPSLNPGTAITIAEPVFMQLTTIKDEVAATTRDGVKVTVPFEVTLAMQFAITITARDTPVRTHPASLTISHADSLNDLIAKEARKHANARRKQFRSELSTFQYLIALLSSPPKGSAYIVFSPTKPLKAGAGQLFVPDGAPQAGKLDYSLVSWGLLFGES